MSPSAGNMESIDIAISENVSATSAMNSALERLVPEVVMGDFREWRGQ
jgi:hypothetical protein